MNHHASEARLFNHPHDDLLREAYGVPREREASAKTSVLAWSKRAIWTVAARTGRVLDAIFGVEPPAPRVIPFPSRAQEIERYTFSLNQSFTLGVKAKILMVSPPDRQLRPKRLTMNAPCPGFVLIAEIKIANVEVTVGGVMDAFVWSPLGGNDCSMDLPSIGADNRVSILGEYTGLYPGAPYAEGAPYLFAVSFTGPATLVL